MAYDSSLHSIILESEKGNPWFEARAGLVTALARKRLRGIESASILDLGCGTGMVASRLAAAFRGSLTAAMDLSMQAASAGCPPALPVCGDLLMPPFRGGCDLVLMLDVIEHFRDDAGVLRTAGELLSPGGAILLTVPALGILWSGYDLASGHERRYSIRMLEEAVSSAGLETAFSSYFMSFLTLPLLLRRRLSSRRGTDQPGALVRSELRSGQRLSGLFRALASIERRALLAGLRLPPGSSALAVAIRPRGR